jgi:ribonuclease P protein component
VSRKVGNAVCRNRFKRRVRAWFRERRGQLGENVDLVVIARKSGGQLDSVELDARLGELLGLANAVR